MGGSKSERRVPAGSFRASSDARRAHRQFPREPTMRSPREPMGAEIGRWVGLPRLRELPRDAVSAGTDDAISAGHSVSAGTDDAISAGTDGALR